MVQQKYNTNQKCNSKFLVATIKNIRKTDEIHFKTLYLTQYLQNVIILIHKHNDSWDILHYFFILSVQTLEYVLHYQHISVWTSYMSNVNNLMWWVAVVLDSEGLRGSGNYACSLWTKPKQEEDGKDETTWAKFTDQINNSTCPRTEWGEAKRYIN